VIEVNAWIGRKSFERKSEKVIQVGRTCEQNTVSIVHRYGEVDRFKNEPICDGKALVRRFEIEEVVRGAKAGKAEESWLRPYDGTGSGIGILQRCKSRREPTLNTFLYARLRDHAQGLSEWICSV
jgi:hypothetical protein